MNIDSRNPYPSGDLSNLFPHAFVFDDVECASMEGFLQSLKVSNVDLQKQICFKWGIEAKKFGSKIEWWKEQTLYWKGVPYKRDSQEYQTLLNTAYTELAKQNNDFRKALLDTGSELLTHDIGKKNIQETILTEHEFCSKLMALRLMIKEGKI